MQETHTHLDMNMTVEHPDDWFHPPTPRLLWHDEGACLMEEDGRCWRKCFRLYEPAGPRPHHHHHHHHTGPTSTWLINTLVHVKRKKKRTIRVRGYYYDLEQPPSPWQREISSLLVCSPLPADAPDPSNQKRKKNHLAKCWFFLEILKHKWYTVTGDRDSYLISSCNYSVQPLSAKSLFLCFWS